MAPGVNRGDKIDKPDNPNKPYKPENPGTEDKDDKKANKANILPTLCMWKMLSFSAAPLIYWSIFATSPMILPVTISRKPSAVKKGKR